MRGTPSHVTAECLRLIHSASDLAIASVCACRVGTALVCYRWLPPVFQTLRVIPSWGSSILVFSYTANRHSHTPVYDTVFSPAVGEPPMGRTSGFRLSHILPSHSESQLRPSFYPVRTVGLVKARRCVVQTCWFGLNRGTGRDNFPTAPTVRWPRLRA